MEMKIPFSGIILNSWLEIRNLEYKWIIGWLCKVDRWNKKSKVSEKECPYLNVHPELDSINITQTERNQSYKESIPLGIKFPTSKS